MVAEWRPARQRANSAMSFVAASQIRFGLPAQRSNSIRVAMLDFSVARAEADKPDDWNLQDAFCSVSIQALDN
jgi:hypothetical protein